MQEKANFRSSHPDVIAHTNATNAGNKRSFSEIKVDDMVLTQQKRQRDMGRYEAMINFKGKQKMKHTWSVSIFDNVKGGGGGGGVRLCHSRAASSSSSARQIGRAHV